MVRVKDLKDQIRMEGRRPVLLCNACSETYSANAGDYFAADPETVFECCGTPMVLVVPECRYRAV